PMAPLAKRSTNYVSQQFGADVKWAAINSAVWSAISARKDHVLTLAGVDAVAKIAPAEITDVLAVLALLSRPGAELLTMEYLPSGGEDASRVSKEEVAKRLRAWWRDKTLTESEWREWASKVAVRW